MTPDSNENPILSFKPDCEQFLTETKQAFLNMINALQNIRHERRLERYLHDVDGDMNVLTEELKKIIGSIQSKFHITLSLPFF